MIKLSSIAWLAILMPGAAISAAANQSLDEPESTAIPTLSAAITRPHATEMLHGVVDRVDQASNSIDIRLSHDQDEVFKVQDGLIFDAVRFGDSVEISVQTIAGVRTIVRLLKE